MKIVLLGGAGIIGKVIARDLALSNDVAEIVIADLNEAGAQAAEASAAPGDSRFKAAAIDVTDRAALVNSWPGVASSTACTLLPTMRLAKRAAITWIWAACSTPPASSWN
jgi:saccharopine dehydrogenase-like NADP-dependent oxidoreductase